MSWFWIVMLGGVQLGVAATVALVAIRFGDGVKGFFAGLAFTLAVISGYLAAVMVIAALVGAGVANAEGSMGDHSAVAYAAELGAVNIEAVNIDGTLPNAVAGLATIICEKRAAGASEAQIIRVSEQQGSTQQATVVVLRAEFHFCPQYATSYQIGYAG
jgi:hypothetical protein